MKTENNRKLKGTVLFTVVSVLSIMIILMTCALAMAAAANRRSRKTYSSSQSTYTARTAIDSILAAIGTDAKFSKAVRDLKDGNSLNVLVDLNDPTMGTIDNVVIKRTGTRSVFDPVNMKWVDRNLYTITADVTIGGETTTISSCILQDAPDGGGGGGGGGAAFLSFGKTEPAQKIASWGGTFFGMGEWDDSVTKEKVMWNDDNAFKFYSWDRTKTNYTDSNYFTTLQDQRYLTNASYYVKNASVAEAPFVCNGDFYSNTSVNYYYTYEAYGAGNKGFEIWGNYVFQNAAGQIDGSGNVTDQSTFKILASDKLIDTLTSQGSSLDFMSTPYFYIDGGMISENKVWFGDSSKKLPLNIFCGTMKVKGNEARFWGDVYCMDEATGRVVDKTSDRPFDYGKYEVGKNQLGTNATNLYAWANATVNGVGAETMRIGNLYCKGDLEIVSGTNVIDGDLRIEGNLKVTSGKLTVKGALIVGKKIEIESGATLEVNNKRGAGKAVEVASGIYCNDAIGGSFSGTAGLKDGYEAKKIDYIIATNVKWKDEWGNVQDVTKSDEHGKYVYMLPAGLNSGVSYTKNGNVYDFGGKLISNENGPAFMGDIIYYTGNVNSEHKSKDVYVKAGTDIEVTENEALALSNITFNGSAVGKASEYVSNYGDIYPNRAEREVLIGAERWLRVKGVAGNVVKYSDVPSGEASKMVSNVHTNSTGGLTVGVGALTDALKGSCTLKGKFTDVVNIKPAKNQTIYVLLLDAEFECTETTENGIKKIGNEAYIDVDRSLGGDVKFVIAGDTTSNYDFTDDIKDTRLVMTVYDWMNHFNFNDSSKQPGTIAESSFGDLISNKSVIQTNAISPSSPYKQIVLNSDTYIKGGADKPNGDETVWASPQGTLDIVVPVPKNEGEERWIVLDGVNLGNGWRILVDDTDKNNKGTVNFYILNECTLDGGKDEQFRGIVSMSLLKSFLDSDSKINIVSSYDKDIYSQIVNNKPTANDKIPVLEPLKIAIYAGYRTGENDAPNTPSKLNILNHAIVTAYVRGTRTLDVYLTNANNSEKIYNTIIYDGKPLAETVNELKEGTTNGVSVLGMFNVHACKTLNDWDMIYVCPDPSDQTSSGGGGVVDAEGAHKYDAVEYTAYVR